jgi:hypothetical protein
MYPARRLYISEGFSPISFENLIPGIRIYNIEVFQSRLRNLLRRHILEHEEETILLEEEIKTNYNPNFMKEKDINFRLYPFYINWKKLEANELDYYHIYIRYGFFGAALYSSFNEKMPLFSLTLKNIIYILSSFVQDYLFKKDNKEESIQKKIKDFFEIIPNLDDLCKLIKKKIIMMKEVPLILIILKIYEINYLIDKNYKDMEKLLKSEYLLGTYLNNEEYSDIYKSNFKGKVNQIFIKIANEKGKEYALPKTKEKLNNHIKYVYNKFIKSE